MAVLRPLKVVIENYPEGQIEELEAVNHPEDPNAGTRRIPFGRELFIERDDFMENPPKKFFRLSPGAEVRLRYAYFITCREVVKDAVGRSGRAALHLRSGDERRQRARRPQGEGDDALGVGGEKPARPKCGSTIRCSRAATRTRRYLPNDLNPNSLEVLERCARRARARRCDNAGEAIQFERQGYFCRDQDWSPAARCSTARWACATPGPRWWAREAERTGDIARQRSRRPSASLRGLWHHGAPSRQTIFTLSNSQRSACRGRLSPPRSSFRVAPERGRSTERRGCGSPHPERAMTRHLNVP